MTQEARVDFDGRDIERTAHQMAVNFGKLFLADDEGLQSKAIRYCESVDRLQFQHLNADEVQLASEAYVEALWEKDDLELACMGSGCIQKDGIRDADYSPVRKKLRTRASVIGADQRYAMQKAKAWQNHKSGGDYWTPYQEAQVYELRAALQNPEFPEKPKYGQSGPGPEPMRYALAAELHDMHTDKHHQQAVEVLTPYFQRILEAHTNE